MPIRLKCRLRALALLGTAAAGLVLASSVGAENTVTLTIVPRGELHAGVIDGELQPIQYSDAATVDTSSLDLFVSDPRGSSVGWKVAISSSDFIYQGDSPTGRNIPNSSFRIASLDAPEVIAGQPVVAGGPLTGPLTGATLDTPRTVIWAEPGAGSGDYRQQIEVLLDIPPGSQPGTYVATLTVAFSSGP